MEQGHFSLQARATGPGLVLVVELDNLELYHQELGTDITDISGKFCDEPYKVHVVNIRLRNKRTDHTKIDAAGNILEDRVIEISAVKINDIEINKILQSLATYEHDFNGTAASRKDDFLGVMGCNGTVSFRFVSPACIWLLENI